MSTQRADRDAKAVSGRVVVILRNQHRRLLASAAGTKARLAI
jgi:hypothetical protein